MKKVVIAKSVFCSEAIFLSRLLRIAKIDDDTRNEEQKVLK